MESLIYIVEDDEGVCEVYEGAFEDAYKTMFFENGTDFLAEFSLKRPDLVILDIMLPDMDGYTILSKIRQLDERVPVIIVSAKSDEISFVKGLNKGEYVPIEAKTSEPEFYLVLCEINELNESTHAHIREILDLSLEAFSKNDLSIAYKIEPLEQVVDELKEQLRTRHIYRLQQGNCSISAGFVWSDILTNLERTADHCSNIAACIIDTANDNLNLHESVREIKAGGKNFNELYSSYSQKYALPKTI